MKKVLVILSIIFSFSGIYAQSDIDTNTLSNSTVATANQGIVNVPPTNTEVDIIAPLSVMTSHEWTLGIAILFFGIIILLLQVHLIKVETFDQNQILKFYIITLIVIAALFMIAAGLEDSQIAPAMGLFGTIVGYLLGKDSKTNTTNKTNNTEQK